MSETFRFIHAADLHLGSFLNINGKPQESIQMLCSSAVYDAFEKICSNAILYKVDFILLCGDVYDSYLRSVRGNKFFVNQCERLNEKGIFVYVIYGNHDAIEVKEELFDMPPNVHILSPNKAESFDVCKHGEVVARIVGRSYKHRSEKEKIYENYTLSNEVFNIAMLHTALEGDNKNYVPCTVDELRNIPNIDYWALGHIHKTKILSERNPVIAFPGIPQGRDMGEQGIGGVFYVEVCNKEVVCMEFLPIATVIYKSLEIIIEKEDKIENYSDLLQMIFKKISSFKFDINEVKGYIVQLIIRGRTKLHDKINDMREEDYKSFIESVNEEFALENNFMWVDSIIFRTALPMQDFESLKMQNSIFQELEEVIRLYSLDCQHKKQLEGNLGAIWKQQVYTESIEEDKFDFNEEILNDIILQAKELIIEKLAEALE